MKISSISMKEVLENETYFRVWIEASELPEWMYEKALEIDEEYEYLEERESQLFEIEGYLTNGKASELKLVYYFDDYETIVEINENDSEDIYLAFEDFVNKYGPALPDNRKLLLGDGDYEAIIPNNIKDEWER